MQDGTESSQGPVADPPLTPPLAPPVRRASGGGIGGGKALLIVALIAFIGGGALAGALVWRGDLDPILPQRQAEAAAQTLPASEIGEVIDPRILPPAKDANARSSGLGDVETRLALLEDRFSRIGVQATAAGANASRAEALLVALAARRRLDRGEPLGYVEDQLKLRFGDAQPQAVRTIIAASRDPVTLHLLSSQLEAATPALTGTRTEESYWSKLRREVSSLFVVRRRSSSSVRQLDRAERAQILLKAGQIEDAIAEVERLPGAADAQEWIIAARRYDQAQRALDLIETSAMLEPRQLRDDTGVAVNQPSPLAPPAEDVAEQPARR